MPFGRRLPALAAAVGRAVVVPVGYTALFPIFYWNQVRHLPTRLMSDGSDGAAFLWSYEQFPRALLHGHNPFHTDLLFHPLGASLAFHANMPAIGMVVWLLRHLVGFTVAVNLTVVGAVVAGACGVFLLALRAAGDRRVAFVAGAAWAFLPWHHFRLQGHHNLNHVWVIPFGIVVLERLFDDPSRKRAVQLGAFVAVAAWVDYSLTLLMVMAMAAIVVTTRAGRTRLVLRRLLLAAGAAVAVALPVVVAVGAELARGGLGPIPGWGGSDIYSADLLGWILPAGDNRWVGRRVVASVGAITSGEKAVFPGLLIVVLAMVGAFLALSQRTRERRWIVVFLVFFALSLGPFLTVNGWTGSAFHHYGRDFTVPLPYFLIRETPVLNSVRAPARFVLVGALGLDVLAAVGLAWLTRSFGNGRLRAAAGWVVPAAALVVVVLELAPHPYPAGHRAGAPAAYRAVAASRLPGAVLEVPLQWREGYETVGDAAGDDSIFEYWETAHDRPIAGGVLSRFPEQKLKQLQHELVYRQVLALQDQPGAAPPATFTVADLRRLRIRFVVLHRDRPRPAVADYVRGLGLRPVADDGVVEVLEVP